jgi:hypothetical protein
MENELLEAFKRYIDVEIDDEEHNDILNEILGYVEDYIYTAYGVSIFKRELVDVVYANYGTSQIYTTDGYITGITSFSVNGENVDVSDLSFSRNKIRVLNGAVILNPTYPVDIAYTVGYETLESVPKGLINALFIISKKVWNDSTKDTDTMSSVSIGIKESFQVFEELPVIAQRTLESHRMYRL